MQKNANTKFEKLKFFKEFFHRGGISRGCGSGESAFRVLSARLDEPCGKVFMQADREARYNRGGGIANPLHSEDFTTQEAAEKERDGISSWIKVGAVAALSALAGGVTAAWFYRKTLTRLHTASLEQTDSNFRTGESSEDEI